MKPLRPEQVRVVLVETMGEANLGAAARSLSCFGVEDWCWVRPAVRGNEQARNWACHGEEWLLKARQFSRLEEALEDVDLALALTGVEGKRRHRMVTPAELHSQVFPRFQLGRVALVFGNEESGLNNQDMRLCHWRVKVPTRPDHMSLNLAHTVTLMLHELLGRETALALESKPKERAAPPDVLQRALAEFSEFMSLRGYPGRPRRLEVEMRKVNDVLHRAQLEEWEVNFFLGMLRHLRNYEAGKFGQVPGRVTSSN